ncbi:EEF1G [Acanthosepion pharaonis]|uniref:Elongation factor 1-gamma n=1 Tax=Acanthosepion pharaonis TaxID=158019 RepID=A0A812BQ20_ACAPH|nr:EEF1G [Sepia pharaonis]
MASGTLYTYPENFRAYKILIAAKYSGANVTVASAPPAFQFGETNKSKEFLDKFPIGKVPAFENSSGECFFESNAIAHYVGSAQLRGTTDEDAAHILQWINFADNEILPASCTWVYPCLGIIQFNKQETEKAKEQIKKVLKILNDYLQTRTYLVGERITQADITVACNMLQLYKYVLDAEFRSPYINVNRWFTTMINQTHFKSVVGNVQMCEKMAQFDPKKYAEIHGQGRKDKRDKAQKTEKAKTPPKPKQQEVKKDPSEEPEPKPPKKEDPFAKFPKGNFNMDEFKRTYSNNDTVTVAMPYFWEHFEKENYSIWRGDYKYNNELTQVFMTCNLVGGMFQRLEKMKKNAFACVLIFGENNSNSISGIWVWPSQELAFELCPDWQVDYEVYEWTKLDPDEEKTRTMVKEYFAMEGDFDGRKFNQGKVFK